MRPSLPLLAVAFCATAVQAQQDLPYLDDRSTPEALVESFYNAVNRGEHARAWSYYQDGEGIGDFGSFARGYAETTDVAVSIGKMGAEGAASSTYYTIPVSLDALDTEGQHSFFAGCYTARLANPALQAEPPFRPMHLVSGTLGPTQRAEPPPETCEP